MCVCVCVCVCVCMCVCVCVCVYVCVCGAHEVWSVLSYASNLGGKGAVVSALLDLLLTNVLAKPFHVLHTHD